MVAVHVRGLHLEDVPVVRERRAVPVVGEDEAVETRLVRVILARLGPVPAERPNRSPGGWEGMVWIADDFDAPLPTDVQRYFEGAEDDGGSV